MKKLLIISSLIVLVICACFNQHNTRPFTVEDWENVNINNSLLADDIVSSKMLLGLTKLEVVKILGEPLSKENDFQDLIDEGAIVYQLGQSIHDPMDADWLKIWFKNDTVIKCEILTE